MWGWVNKETFSKQIHYHVCSKYLDVYKVNHLFASISSYLFSFVDKISQLWVVINDIKNFFFTQIIANYFTKFFHALNRIEHRLNILVFQFLLIFLKSL